MTIWHLRDLAAGKKRIIKSDQVKVITIPQYEGLKVECILEFARGYPEAFQFLPIEKEIKKLTRVYLGNVIYTVIGEPFSQWVQMKVNERHEKIKQNQHMMIDLDPEIAQIFQSSSSVSVSKGNSAHLMKASAQRRRTKQEILEDKRREQEKQQDIEMKLNELEQLRQRMAEVEQRVKLAEMVEGQFQVLADQGKMKVVGDGQVDIVDDPEERQFLMESIRKEKESQSLASGVQGENLLARFNEADPDDLE